MAAVGYPSDSPPRWPPVVDERGVLGLLRALAEDVGSGRSVSAVLDDLVAGLVRALPAAGVSVVVVPGNGDDPVVAASDERLLQSAHQRVGAARAARPTMAGVPPPRAAGSRLHAEHAADTPTDDGSAVLIEFAVGGAVAALITRPLPGHAADPLALEAAHTVAAVLGACLSPRFAADPVHGAAHAWAAPGPAAPGPATDVLSLIAPDGRRSPEAEFLEALFGVGIWVWDVATDEVTASDTTRALLDIPATSGPLALDDMLVLRTATDRKVIKQLLIEAFADEGGDARFQHEHQLTVRQQTRRHRLSGVVQRRDELRPPAVLLVEADITATFGHTASAEQRRLATELELQRSERRRQALSEYLAVLAHDLRSPLRQLANFADLMSTKWAGAMPPDAAPIVGYLRDGTAEAAAMVDDLLDFATAGADALSIAPVDLSQVVSTAWSAVDAPADARLVTASLPVVDADARAVGRIMANLFENAVKYRSEQPLVVEVAATRAGLDWRISVTDNGIGMPVGGHASAFGLFQRLHSGHAGKGLGLAIVRQAVQAHGGDVWALPAPSGGTTVVFSLPTADTARPLSPPAPGSARWPAPPR